MTNLKSTILTTSALVLSLSLAACGQETNEAIKTAETKVVETASTQIETNQTATPVKPEATPVSAPADAPQSAPQPTAEAENHDGHDHGADDGHDHSSHAAPIDIDFVYDIAPDDFTVGGANAPVNMIVYASVVCGHCGGWFTNDWPVIKEKYIDTGKLQMAFREIPTQPQEIAVPGFIVAACAPEDEYMDMIVHQMQTQEETFAALKEGTFQTIFDGWTIKAGLDTEAKLKACFERKDHITRLNASSQRMTAAGLMGVPSIIINGEPFKDQDKSAEALSKRIDALLE